jgi:hypothetical protein
MRIALLPLPSLKRIASATGPNISPSVGPSSLSDSTPPLATFKSSLSAAKSCSLTYLPLLGLTPPSSLFGIHCWAAPLYYWRGMHADVTRYVETCHICQTAKEDLRKRAGDPRALQIPESPWDVVHLDWISGFQKSPEGYDCVLVFVDALTGMVHLQACKKTDTSKDTAHHFVKNVARLHGMPRAVVSDRKLSCERIFGAPCNSVWGPS